MDKDKKNFNPEDVEIAYNERVVKISELTDKEKIDCIYRLWHYKENLENENEVLQEMIQKMYFFGKMEKIQEEKDI